ncbi:MAG: hypothetical protein AAGG08_04360, partial [Actinomycetota bacterium]
PGEFRAWSARAGLEPGAISGPITIAAALEDDQRTVASATITTADGQSVAYELLDVTSRAPVITLDERD